MADALPIETRTPDQLPPATAVSPDALVTIQEPHGPVKSLPIKALFGRLISTDAAFEEEAAPNGIQGHLDHDEDSIGLVYADPAPEKNGWYRKVGASGAGEWSQFEKLSAYAAAEVQSLVDAAEAAAATIYADPANNVGYGPESLGGWTGPGIGDAASNTGFGAMAGGSLIDGSSNVNVGTAAGRANTDGDNNVNIGPSAGLLAPSGDNNTRVGYNAQGGAAAATDRVTAIGAYALQSFVADEAVGLGYGVGNGLTTAVRFTGVGTGAGGNVNRDGCTFIGWGSGGHANQSLTHTNMTAIGQDSYCTFENQVTLGDDQVRELRFAGTVFARAHAFGRVVIGQNAGNRSTVGGGGVIIGYEAGVGCNSALDERQAIIGYLACNEAVQCRAWVAIGDRAGQYAYNTIDCTLTGSEAGRNLGRLVPAVYDTPDDEAHIKAAGDDVSHGGVLPVPGLVGATGYGKNALRYNTIGPNNTGFGDSTLGFTTVGGMNVAVGYVCGEGNVIGSRNSWLGQGIRVYQYSGDDNAQIGYEIGTGVGSFGNWLPGGSRNSNLGTGSVYYWAGDDTASLGFQALRNLSGGTGGDVALGARGGGAVLTGGRNIFIGQDAGFGDDQATDVQNSIAIGAGVVTTKSDQIVIGNDDHDEIIVCGTTFTKAQVAALLALVTP